MFRLNMTSISILKQWICFCFVFIQQKCHFCSFFSKVVKAFLPNHREEGIVKGKFGEKNNNSRYEIKPVIPELRKYV